MDPYQVLGVAPNASTDEIHGAYRDLARRLHRYWLGTRRRCARDDSSRIESDAPAVRPLPVSPSGARLFPRAEYRKRRSVNSADEYTAAAIRWGSPWSRNGDCAASRFSFDADDLVDTSDVEEPPHHRSRGPDSNGASRSLGMLRAADERVEAGRVHERDRSEIDDHIR
jgi:hypothetical protein